MSAAISTAAGNRHIIIGVSISICGNMVVSLALNTQRLAHLRLERSGKPYLRSWLWWLGICLMTIGETGNFLAYGFAPASIVAPLGTITIISNAIIAPLLLNEQSRWRDWAGMAVATAGAVLVILSASGRDPQLDPDSIWQLCSAAPFLIYLAVEVVLIMVLLCLSRRYGSTFIMIDLCLVALFALSTKGVSSLLSGLLFKAFEYDITYLLIAILCFTAVMQIKYLNQALRYFDATKVIPTQFVLFTISTITGSAILYRDFEEISLQRGLLFGMGCLLTYCGVYMIMTGTRVDGAAGSGPGDDESEALICRAESSANAPADVPSEVLNIATSSAAPSVGLRPSRSRAILVSPANHVTGTLLLNGLIHAQPPAPANVEPSSRQSTP